LCAVISWRRKKTGETSALALSLKEGSSLSAPIFVEYGKAGETSEIGRRHRFPLA